MGFSKAVRDWAFFEDLRANREGLLSLGFWALQVYRFGHLRYRFQSRLIRIPLGVLHIVLAKLAEMLTGITIGVSAKIGRRLVIEHSGAIVVHGTAELGDDCIIRQGVTIGNRRLDDPLGAPIIGNRVNVGAGAKILGRLRIGDDAEIGANAVVLKDVPDGAVAVGIPARILIKRPTQVEPLVQSETAEAGTSAPSSDLFEDLERLDEAAVRHSRLSGSVNQ